MALSSKVLGLRSEEATVSHGSSNYHGCFSKRPHLPYLPTATATIPYHVASLLPSGGSVSCLLAHSFACCFAHWKGSSGM